MSAVDFAVIDGPLHIVPVNDLREHESSSSCWCKPLQDEEEPSVWIHNSLDGREAYEVGRALS